MEIKHFSHPWHSLILVADDEGRKDSRRQDLVCGACNEPVIINNTWGGYYRCGGGCEEFTLHKRCAELPRKIHYPRHPKHPLHILSNSLHTYCNVCGRGYKRIAYHCRTCDYNVDVVCALAHLDVEELLAQTKEMRVWEIREIHPHPLNLHPKRAKFFCDICLTKDVEDFPFICTDHDCSFSIHKRCAHAPPTLHLIHHHREHPLHLSHSLPDKYYSFLYNCDICNESLLRDHWLYYCANCRYFSHVKCAFKAQHQPPSGDQHGDDVEEEEVDPNDPFMNLPFPDLNASSDLLSLCLKDNTNGEASIQHWGHAAHPLTLVDQHHINQSSTDIIIGDDPITICDGCVRPISVPYYSCDQCNFYLHKHCAKLPHTLKHLLHPHHSLLLDCFDESTGSIRCHGCHQKCNKFLYQCNACDFCLDVNCAFLPQRIKHEKHKHPLLQCLVKCTILPHRFTRNESYKAHHIEFRCDNANCSFSISLFEVMLPRSIKHRYDKEHPILLTYPPVKDHPQEFFCELCETEIYPKYWMYHCSLCAFSFHTNCLYRRDPCSNLKLESFHTSARHNRPEHRHPLSYTRRKKNSKKFLCSVCNLDINGRLILECNLCKFQKCVDCGPYEDVGRGFGVIFWQLTRISAT